MVGDEAAGTNGCCSVGMAAAAATIPAAAASPQALADNSI